MLIITLASVLIGLFILALSYLYYIFRIHKLPPSPPAKFFEDLIIGHRGCNLINTDLKGLGIPENSLPAFNFALEHGVDGIEIDITLSKDMVPLVLHDATTKRLLEDSEDSTLPREVSELTLSQLQSLTYRACQELPIQGLPEKTHVPTLKQVLEITKSKSDSERKIRLMIELKHSRDPHHLAKSIVSLFQEYDLYETAVVGSFDPFSLYLVRQLNPKIVTLLLVCRGMVSYLFGQMWLYRFFDHLLYYSYVSWLPVFLGVGVIGIHNELIRDGSFVVEDWQRKGYVINCWTVNQLSEFLELRSKKVSVTTDFVFPKFMSGQVEIPKLITADAT